MFIFNVAIPFCLLSVTISLALIASYGVQKVQARIEEFNDTNNNLTVSIQAPDNWNSGIASATMHAINWRGYGLAAVNDNGSALFAIVNLPPVANMVPLSQITGLINTLLSQYVTIDNQYKVNFTDGSTGYAYSISATPGQLSKIQSIVPSINKPFDAALIITQHHGVSYAIVYATQFGRMGEFLGLFQNILSSVKFG